MEVAGRVAMTAAGPSVAGAWVMAEAAGTAWVMVVDRVARPAAALAVSVVLAADPVAV